MRYINVLLSYFTHLLTAITFHQFQGYRSSCRASLPVDKYQIILLGDRGRHV